MTSNVLEELRDGLETAYIDSTIPSNYFYKPQFIRNNYHAGKKSFIRN